MTIFSRSCCSRSLSRALCFLFTDMLLLLVGGTAVAVVVAWWWFPLAIPVVALITFPFCWFLLPFPPLLLLLPSFCLGIVLELVMVTRPGCTSRASLSQSLSASLQNKDLFAIHHSLTHSLALDGCDNEWRFDQLIYDCVYWLVCGWLK